MWGCSQAMKFIVTEDLTPRQILCASEDYFSKPEKNLVAKQPIHFTPQKRFVAFAGCFHNSPVTYVLVPTECSFFFFPGN